MSEFEQIRADLQVELAELNAIIERSLRSDHQLVERIVADYLKKKGKQLRPILTILTGKLFGGSMPCVLQAAAAVELLHNASLIHDDVIDESAQRRGRPTINHVWDNHIAVLIGDFFVSSALACGVASGCHDVVRVLARRGRELSLGEINQIDSTRRQHMREDVYFDIIRHKTAALFCSCMEVGAYAAGAPQSQRELIVAYAELLGLCFQIKDDIFDYYDDAAVGKPTGNDLREGKRTLPLIHALSTGGDTAERRQMIALAEKQSLSDDEIRTLVRYAKSHGGIAYAESCMASLRDRAMAILDGLAQSPEVGTLRRLFTFVIERDK